MNRKDLSSIHDFVASVRRTATPALVVCVDHDDGLAFVGPDAHDLAAALGVILAPDVAELDFAPQDLARIEAALVETQKPFVVARRGPDSEFRLERIVVSDISESFAYDAADRLPLAIPESFRLRVQEDGIYVGADGIAITGCELLFEWEGRLERYRTDICSAEARTRELVGTGQREFLGTALHLDGRPSLVLSREGTAVLAAGAGALVPHRAISDWMPPGATPWGSADAFRRVGEGVAWVTTPSHGGLFLPPRLARDLAVALGQPSSAQRPAAQWFEEDIAWSIPVVVFPRLFSDFEVFRAAEVQRSTFGDKAVCDFIESPAGQGFRQRLANVTQEVSTAWRITMIQGSGPARDCMWKVDVRHMMTREERSVITQRYPRSEFLTGDQLAQLGHSLPIEKLVPAPKPAELAPPVPQAPLALAFA